MRTILIVIVVLVAWPFVVAANVGLLASGCQRIYGYDKLNGLALGIAMMGPLSLLFRLVLWLTSVIVYGWRIEP